MLTLKWRLLAIPQVAGGLVNQTMVFPSLSTPIRISEV